jgi:hypothetical protein
MGGSGILPTTIHNGKLCFLFGKENKYADTPGWSDFGGGKDNNETFIQTAIREGGEELTGFLGSDDDLKKLLNNGTYNIDNTTGYRMHIFYMKYEPQLPHYYNNNQRFLQKRLDPKIIEDSRIFEKEEIRWISINDMKKMRPKFRSYFQEIVDKIYKNRNEIYNFINKRGKKTLKIERKIPNKTLKNRNK